MSNSPNNTQPRHFSLVRWLIISGMALMLLGIGLKGWRIYRLAQNIRQHAASAQSMRESRLANISEDQITTLTANLRRDTVALNQELSPLLPVAPYLGWLPRVGPLMPHVEDLMGMANEATYLADFLAPGLAPALLLISQETPFTATLPEIMAIIDQNEADFQQVEPIYRQMVTRLDRFSDDEEAVAALPLEAESLLQDIKPLLPFLHEGLTLASVLPEAAGYPTEKTYLLVAQNHDELRATGGFISGAGLITVSGGRPGEITFLDAYQVDDFTKPYDIPPRPLEEFMGVQLLVFRDANYWPDFPTSAQKMMELYSYGTGQPVDGIIAIDQQFLTGLVKILEPVIVEGYAEPITGQNVDQFLRNAWEIGDPTNDEWFANRKSFLAPVAAALMNRLLNDAATIDPLGLAQFLNESVQSGHLMVYTTDTHINQALQRSGLTRPVSASPGEDFLMVVSTNVGFNKANAAVTQSVRYEVELGQDRRGIGQTTVTFNHMGADNGEPCRQEINNYGSGEDLYGYLINRCYWNYLRLLTPAGSTPVAGSTHPHAAETTITGNSWAGTYTADATETPGVNTLANLVTVPTASTTSAEFIYELPEIVKQNQAGHHYSLNVVKQPGIDPYPIFIAVTLPENSTGVESNISPLEINGNRLEFELMVDQNFQLQIRYQTMPFQPDA